MQHPSALGPFRHRTFAIMWAAALVSNIGTWMHSIGASWLMTGLSPSPLIISLVQTATTLPVFMFALSAGALADIFNRRKLLIITHTLMFAATAVFAYMVWADQVSAHRLLFFTFLLGMGSAFVAPAWQAVIPRMVPRDELPQAVALGGISTNISRAIGPAFAGLLISLYGLSWPFIANALSFIAIIAALVWWKYQAPTPSTTLPPERVWSAMKTGVRYAFNSEPLKATMWHITGFMFFANAFWGLLPIISRVQLAGDASYFGILMGAMGAGAVICAFLLPALSTRLSANQLVMIGTLGTSLVTAYFAVAQDQTLAVLASLGFGMSWILVLATVNISAQQSLPEWVRARGLAVFLMVFFGSMSLGAAFWGWLAGETSIETAMLSAAMGGIGFIGFSYRAVLQQGRDLDFTPSHHWREPVPHHEVRHDAGPVMIQVAYEVAPEDHEAFLKAIVRIRSSRQRGGAYNWGVYEDTERQGVFIEHFMEESWAGHMRHHEQVPQADKPLQEAVTAFHKGPNPPRVWHLLATPLPKSNRG
jgi:hypothetical protein